MLLRLGDPPGPDALPKLAALSRLHAAGLPVPDGIGLAPERLPDPAVRARLTELLARGPVIVRSALALEDTAETSAAGLGRSIAGCRDLVDVDRAAADIAAACRDPWLVRHAGGHPPAHQLVVQRQVPRRWLAVLAAERDDPDGACLELHGADDLEALSDGATPRASGPLALADPELRAPLTALVRRVASQFDAPALDLEVIVDDDGAAWLVQARPLVRPLVAGWPTFLAAAAPGASRIAELPGLWRLDAEHNPAALSPAHAGVIAWLVARGARLRVLAGWLYEPVSSASSPKTGPDPRAALTALRGEHLPTARRALARLADGLDADADAARPAAPPAGEATGRTARAPDLADRMDGALEHLRWTLDVYAALRVPAPTEVADRAAPLCLRERAAYLDVLPAAWDIASPALSDMLPGACPEEPVPFTIPDDHAVAAALLRELDDHLFALGLAPLRRVYLAAGARLGLAADASPPDVFLLTPPELRRALTDGALPDLRARRAEHMRDAALAPPLALYDGRPVPAPPRGRLRGLPIGPLCRGRIAHRRDLADLLARPPGPEDILVLPALTAQAAVALRALAVRAVCCEHGGALSHAALMARELGLSALIGCRGCGELPDGAPVELDTRLGRLLPLT